MIKVIFLIGLIRGWSALCCDEGDRHRINGANCRYVECKNGAWILSECQEQISSDRGCTSLNCTYSLSTCEDGVVFSYYSQSRHYFICYNGRLILKSCLENESFDVKNGTCSKVITFGLGNNLSGNDNRGSDKDMLEKEENEECRSGEKRKKEGSCKSYYVCRGHEEVLAHCTECKNFDDRVNKCRYVFQAPCNEEGSTETPERRTLSPRGDVPTSRATPGIFDRVTAAPGTTPDPFDRGTAAPGTTPDPFDRGTAAPGTTPDPFDRGTAAPGTVAPPAQRCAQSPERRALPDCKLYLECYHGELVTKACGWFQQFDSQSMACSYVDYTCLGS